MWVDDVTWLFCCLYVNHEQIKMQLVKPYVHVVQNMLLCLALPNIHATQYYFFQNSNTNTKKVIRSTCPEPYLQSLN